MCGHYESDKSVDNLFSITRAAECNYYYVPSLVELEALQRLTDEELASKGKEVVKPVPIEEEVDSGKGKEKGSTSGSQEDEIKILVEYWYARNLNHGNNYYLLTLF